MKKILTFIVSAAVLLSGCSKRIEYVSQGSGSMTVTLDDISLQYFTKASETIFDVNTFDYRICEIIGEEEMVFMEGKIGSLDPVIEHVPVGKYVIYVSSPDRKDAAFDQPIVAGSKKFTISEASITSVLVNCTVQNVKVSLNPDPEFFKELAQFKVIVSNGDGAENKLVWTNGALGGANYSLLTSENVGNSKSGYFSVASEFKIYIEGYRTVSDAVAVYEGSIKNVNAKDHYILNLYATTTGQIGGGATNPGVTITVDYTTNDVEENVDVPGFEIPSVPGSGDGSEDGGEVELKGLSLEWAANPTFGMYELKSKNHPEPYKSGEVTLVVHAENYIKGFIVKIASPTEMFFNEVKAIPGSTIEGDYLVLDLLKTETAEAMKFLPTGDALKDKAQIEFPLDSLLPLICAFSPEVGSVHTFIMQVTDMKDQVMTKELKFEYRGK